VKISRSTLSSARLKIALFLTACLIIFGTLYYTDLIVRALQEREQQVVDLYAKSLEYLASARDMEGDYSFVFDQIIRAIDFPMVLTDARGEPTTPVETASRNVTLDTTVTEAQQRAFLRGLASRMDESYAPIRVTYQDSLVLTVIHYGESPLVRRLRWLPYVEISVVALFILIGYVSFSYIKRSEQGNIWVGMARETAHQLGTPISSMMGWIELLKTQAGRDSPLDETLRDMENDLLRLQKIADRFSKIGSKPDMKREDLVPVIQKVIEYFQRRIPHTGKRVDLMLRADSPVSAHINRELFEWVIENLVKNALDAIENGSGYITIALSTAGSDVYIDVTDTGKGIDSTYRRDIFRPGFSTKTRGWGLGLSLSQRIVESYHSGKLTLKESRPGVGTTFRIKLRS
jgi:signal transduction histidine kinase